MIQTSTDKGIIFKDCYYLTKLEGMWAVFFDNLNINFDYEQRTNILNGKIYVPKFYLHKYDIYVDIYPQKDETIELERIHKFAEQNQLLIIYGEPSVDQYTVNYISEDSELPYVLSDNAVLSMSRRTNCLCITETDGFEICMSICQSFCRDLRCGDRSSPKHYGLENIYSIASQAKFYN